MNYFYTPDTLEMQQLGSSNSYSQDEESDSNLATLRVSKR